MLNLSVGPSELTYYDEIVPTSTYKEHNLYFQFLSVMIPILVNENRGL